MKAPPIGSLLQDALDSALALRARMGRRWTVEERRRLAALRAEIRKFAEQEDAP